MVDRDGLENRCTGNRTEGSNPSLSANKGVNQQVVRFTPFNNPIRFIDPNGEEGDNAPTLYHNTQHPGKILCNGFNATKNGKLSSYNWFSTIANASGTGRTGSGVTLAV